MIKLGENSVDFWFHTHGTRTVVSWVKVLSFCLARPSNPDSTLRHLTRSEGFVSKLFESPVTKHCYPPTLEWERSVYIIVPPFAWSMNSTTRFCRKDIYLFLKELFVWQIDFWVPLSTRQKLVTKTEKSTFLANRTLFFFLKAFLCWCGGITGRYCSWVWLKRHLTIPKNLAPHTYGIQEKTVLMTLNKRRRNLLVRENLIGYKITLLHIRAHKSHSLRFN